MNSSLANVGGDVVATAIGFVDEFLCVTLADGREIRVPLQFYPKLAAASPAMRANYQLIGLGTGIHWPDLDEDLSVEGIVLGYPSRPRM